MLSVELRSASIGISQRVTFPLTGVAGTPGKQKP